MYNEEGKVSQIEKVSKVGDLKVTSDSFYSDLHSPHHNLTKHNLSSPVKQLSQKDGQLHNHEAPRSRRMYNEEGEVSQVEKVSKVEDLKVVTNTLYHGSYN
jgi:hypothetical protein